MIKLTPEQAPNAYKVMGGHNCKTFDAIIKQMKADNQSTYSFTVARKGKYLISKFDPTFTAPHTKYGEYMISKAL